MRLRTLAPHAILLAVVLAIYRAIWTAPSDGVVAGSSTTGHLYWLHRYVGDQLADGRWPLWIPHVYGGAPLAANPSAGVFYPLTWLHAIVSTPQAHAITILAHGVIAAFGARALLLQSGRRELCASVGGVLWAASGPLVARLDAGRLDELGGAAWLPIVVLGARRAFDGDLRRGVAVAAFASAMQLLSGDPLIATTTLLALVAEAGYVLWTRTSARSRVEQLRPAIAISAIVAGAALLAAVLLLPYVEWLAHAVPIDTHDHTTRLSARPLDLIANGALRYTPAITVVRAADLNLGADVSDIMAVGLGTPAFVLAMISLSKRTSVDGRALVWLAAGALFALGWETPVYPALRELVAPLSTFRAPARAGLLVGFGLLGLAARGFEVVADAERRWIYEAVIGGAGAIALLCLSFFGFSVDGPHRLMDPVSLGDAWIWWTSAPLVALAGLLAARTWVPRVRRDVLLASVLAIEAVLSVPPAQTIAESKLRERPLFVFSFVEDDLGGPTGPHRVDLASNLVSPNAGVIAGVENVNAKYDRRSVILERLTETFRPTDVAHAEDHLSVRRYGGDPGDDRLDLRLHSVAWTARFDAREVTLQRARDPLPRAFVVPQAEVVADHALALERIGDPGFDPTRLVLLDRELAGDEPGPRPATTRTSRFSGGGLQIEVDAPDGGYLVLSELAYPGWVATIDGREAPLARADYALVAVAVPAGAHVVRYRYRPATVFWGAAVSIASLLGLLAALLRRDQAVHSRRKA